jgi:hypothetical protein
VYRVGSIPARTGGRFTARPLTPFGQAWLAEASTELVLADDLRLLRWRTSAAGETIAVDVRYSSIPAIEAPAPREVDEFLAGEPARALGPWEPLGSDTLNGIDWTLERSPGSLDTTCWRLTTTPPATPNALVDEEGARCFRPPDEIETTPTEWFEVPFIADEGAVEAMAWVFPPETATRASVTLAGGRPVRATLLEDAGAVVYVGRTRNVAALVTLRVDGEAIDCGPGSIFTIGDAATRTRDEVRAERVEWPWACIPR